MKEGLFDKFTEFVSAKNISLSPWQERASSLFLAEIEKQENGATGKTFLLEQLSLFVSQ